MCIRDRIEHESTYGTDGRMLVKLNSLQDPELIEALYAASNAGVSIELIIRGICCLVPGVPGMSENIRVRSLLGRYLEHSRIIWFAHGQHAILDAGGADTASTPGDAPLADTALYLIGSADWMPRNLDRRVEVMVPVTHPKHQAWLDQVFEFALADDVVRWELGPEGAWRRCGPEHFAKGDYQDRLHDWVAAKQAR